MAQSGGGPPDGDGSYMYLSYTHIEVVSLHNIHTCAYTNVACVCASAHTVLFTMDHACHGST